MKFSRGEFRGGFIDFTWVQSNIKNPNMDVRVRILIRKQGICNNLNRIFGYYIRILYKKQNNLLNGLQRER